MIIEEIRNRRSVRNYKSDGVSEDNILEIIKAAQFAPTSKNNRLVQFIIVQDQKTKEEIYNIVGQEFVREAPVLIVPVTDANSMLLFVQDLSIASAMMFLQATSLRLGTVWKHVGKEFASKVKSLLGIPENFFLINLIAVGFPKEALSGHSDNEFDKNKIHFDQW